MNILYLQQCIKILHNRYIPQNLARLELICKKITHANHRNMPIAVFQTKHLSTWLFGLPCTWFYFVSAWLLWWMQISSNSLCNNNTSNSPHDMKSIHLNFNECFFVDKTIIKVYLKSNKYRKNNAIGVNYNLFVKHLWL